MTKCVELHRIRSSFNGAQRETSVLRLEDGKILVTVMTQHSNEIISQTKYANDADYMANCVFSDLLPI